MYVNTSVVPPTGANHHRQDTVGSLGLQNLGSTENHVLTVLLHGECLVVGRQRHLVTTAKWVINRPGLTVAYYSTYSNATHGRANFIPHAVSDCWNATIPLRHVTLLYEALLLCALPRLWTNLVAAFAAFEVDTKYTSSLYEFWSWRWMFIWLQRQHRKPNAQGCMILLTMYVMIVTFLCEPCMVGLFSHPFKCSLITHDRQNVHIYTSRNV